MKVVIIGTGNVATVLGKRIQNSSNQVVQVIGRNLQKTQALAETLRCSFSLNLLDINISADLIVISITDNAILNVVNQISVTNAIVVHTAASVSMEVLSKSSKLYGILYPLQSLKKDMQSDVVIPLIINGNTPFVINNLKVFANQVSDNVVVATDEERLRLHIAAVFCNNFTNHLLALANAYCQDEELNFNLLRPLIEETFTAIGGSSPKNLQTGPAIRGDEETIKLHLSLLMRYPNLKEVYQTITNSIEINKENSI